MIEQMLAVSTESEFGGDGTIKAIASLNSFTRIRMYDCNHMSKETETRKATEAIVFFFFTD